MVTLILTRKPLRSFRHGAQSGRWGELVAIKGPKVTSARLSSGSSGDSTGIRMENGVIQLTTTGGTLAEEQHFTSMERFHTNDGKGFYVELHPKPDPYWITLEYGNSAVKELRKDHDGRCFRVHGGKPGPEQGILIHEAPHVGWLIGCLSPRPLNNFAVEFKNERGNPSYQAMNQLIQFVGPARADFFVLDW